MFVGKLIGEADGYAISREFEHKAAAIQLVGRVSRRRNPPHSITVLCS